MDTGTRRRRPFQQPFQGLEYQTRPDEYHNLLQKRNDQHEPREDPSSHEHTEPGDIFPYDQHDFRRHQSPTETSYQSETNEEDTPLMENDHNEQIRERSLLERRHETKIFSDLPLKGDIEEKIDDRVLLP